MCDQKSSGWMGEWTDRWMDGGKSHCNRTKQKEGKTEEKERPKIKTERQTNESEFKYSEKKKEEKLIMGETGRD